MPHVNDCIVYGENNPIFTISYDGFVNNENESTLDVIPSATTPATPTSNVGTYTISLNGGSATNYIFTLKSGILTITKAPLAIVINDATRSYGTSNPSFGATYSGLKNDETVTDSTIRTINVIDINEVPDIKKI